MTTEPAIADSPAVPRSALAGVDGQHTVLPGQTPDGQYVLSVLLKRTYDIVSDQVCRRAEADAPLITADTPWGDPVNTTIRYESDFIPYKPATDIILNGTAYAPGGTATRSCDVSLRLEQVQKTIRVFGDRTVQHVPGSVPVFSDPLPFTTMPLRYENAYGGIDVYSDDTFKYPCPNNLMGKGFVVGNTEKSLSQIQLPNLEDPGHLLSPQNLCLEDYQSWVDMPMPTGFCCYPKTWWARAQLVGVMPADREFEKEMRRQYALLVPPEQRTAYQDNGFKDMDFRFFNAASPGLAVPYLTGGERVITRNLCPDGTLRFILPGDTPVIGLDIGKGSQHSEVVRHTVLIRMDDRQVDITWRAAVPYPGPEWLPEMMRMDVSTS